MIPSIDRILYATDLSRNSAYAFRYAMNSAEKHNATIDILYVVKGGVFQGAFDYSAPLSDNKTVSIEKTILQRMESVLKKEPNCSALMKRISSIQVIEGDPVVRILQQVDQLKSNLLVMGTHSKGFIAQTFLGSVATQVLQRVRIPVFIIPIPAKTDIAFDD